MNMTPLGEEILEQLVELSAHDRQVLLEQLTLMQAGRAEIQVDHLLSADGATPADSQLSASSTRH